MKEWQKGLFEVTPKEHELIFAAGPKGLSANLVSSFKIRTYKNGTEAPQKVQFMDATSLPSQFYSVSMSLFTPGLFIFLVRPLLK